MTRQHGGGGGEGPTRSPIVGSPASPSGLRMDTASHNATTHSHKRVLGIWTFAAVAYFAVCGGPFGIEAAVMQAGPLPCFIGFLVLPLIWSLPQALVTAELSTLLPDNGGYVLWVSHAFGDFSGWMCGLNGTVGSIIDLTLYPVIFADIINNAFVAHGAASFGTTYLLRFTLIVVGLIINVCGVSNIGILSMVISGGIMIPFFISFGAQFNVITSNAVAAVGQTAGVVDWSVFLSTILWSYTGWDSLGCLAGEVENPAKTYVLGTLLTTLFVTLSYALPVFVSITTHPNFWEWDQGSLARYTADVAPWLGVACTILSLLCQLGIFTTGLSTNTRAVWALAGGSDVSPELSAPQETAAVALKYDGVNDDIIANTNDLHDVKPTSKHQDYVAVVHLPQFLAVEWARTGAPINSIVLHGVLICAMCLLPFDTLVQADVLLACVRLIFELAAFLALRFIEPPATRNPQVFTIPGGWSMVVATCGPKLAIIAIVVMSAEPVVWLIVLIVNVIGAAVFSFRVLYDRRFYGRWWPRGRFNLGVPSHMSTPAALSTGCADIDGDTGTASGIGRDTGQHVRKRDRPS